MCYFISDSFHAGQTFWRYAGSFSDYGSPGSDSLTVGQAILAAAAFAAISVVFCIALHLSEHTYKKYIANPYLAFLSAV